MSMLAPHRAAAKTIPHALAWNCGTIVTTRSSCESASASVMHAHVECRASARWEYRTPFGSPVVPLV